MLPDYPGLKRDLTEAIREFTIARRDDYLGALGSIPRMKVFEGDTHAMTRETGEVNATTFELQRSELTIHDAELEEMTLASLLIKMDGIARDMAGQTARRIYSKVSEAADEVDNVVSAGGGGVTPELFLSLLTKIEIDFDPDGNPRMPEIHLHPINAEAFMKLQESFESDPPLRAQHDAVMERKKEEWRAREARRKLVG